MAQSLMTAVLALSSSVLPNFDPDGYLNFYKKPDDYKRMRLSEAHTVINTTYFNTSYVTELYAFGFNGTTNDIYFKSILNSFLVDGTNAVALDWQEAASTGPIPYVLYPRAVRNSKILGNKLGTAIVKMVAAGMNLDKLHLIGLSLGAHLCGAAGRQVYAALGAKVPRITGLEPAGIGFSGITEIATPLQAGDAQWVDCLHTDPGGYGTKAAICDLDIYANCQNFAEQAAKGNIITTYNYSNEQPGCPPRNLYPPMSEQNFCSHARPCLLFAESRLHPLAEPCGMSTSCAAWIASNGVFDQINYIGPNVDRKIKGLCYLSTNATSLYGKGTDGLKP